MSFFLAFSAGDILIFTIRTIHMSSVNVTNKLRLSCDTRWQPSNEPADPRFVQLAKKCNNWSYRYKIWCLRQKYRQSRR